MAKLGLVLSGGGAKGAYHVGVIKALQEVGIQIDMISGASIGALNAAVLLSAENQQQGLNHLEQLWDKLPSIKPIQFKGMEDITDFFGFKKSNSFTVNKRQKNKQADKVAKKYNSGII